MESLSNEVSAFGIKSVIFEPGLFRTKAFDKLDHQTSSIPEYHDFYRVSREYEQSIMDHDPGDPKDAVESMIDVVRGEGLAAGKALPLRIPIGKDAQKIVRDQCSKSLKVCEDWEDLIVSSNTAK